MKKLLWIVLLVVVAYLAWRWWRGPSDAATADRGQSLVFDRMWVDHLPTSQTDAFDIFAAVTEQPIGVFDHRSQWKGEWELFRYEPRGDGQLELLLSGVEGARRACRIARGSAARRRTSTSASRCRAARAPRSTTASAAGRSAASTAARGARAHAGVAR